MHLIVCRVFVALDKETVSSSAPMKLVSHVDMYFFVDHVASFATAKLVKIEVFYFALYFGWLRMVHCLLILPLKGNNKRNKNKNLLIIIMDTSYHFDQLRPKKLDYYNTSDMQ